MGIFWSFKIINGRIRNKMGKKKLITGAAIFAKESD
jgi:hypothetical protein